jgi:hypothetical protein
LFGGEKDSDEWVKMDVPLWWKLLWVCVFISN